MKRKTKRVILIAAFFLCAFALAAISVSYAPGSNYMESGGALWRVGGRLDISTGGIFSKNNNTIALPATASALLYSSLTTNAIDAANSIWGASNQLVFEGSGVDVNETVLTSTNPTADRTITIPNESGAIMLSSLTTNAPDIVNSVTGGTNQLLFEGTADAIETIVTATDATVGDKTITLPNASGTVMLSSLAGNGADLASSVTGVSDGLIFEGSGVDDFETTLLLGTNPTADVTLKLPDSSGTFVISTLDLNAPELAGGVWLAQSRIIFEGTTADNGELTVSLTDPPNAADIAITLPAYTGDVPVIVTQDAVAHVATDQTTDGTSISVPDDVFGAGTALRFSCTGTIAGANAAKSMVMYIDNAAIVTLTTAAAIVGDYTFDCIIAEHTAFANQKVFCKAQTGAVEYLTDYATDTTNFAAGAITVKTQVISANIGDTITQEFCVVEFLP